MDLDVVWICDMVCDMDKSTNLILNGKRQVFRQQKLFMFIEIQINKIQDSILKTKSEFKDIDRIIDPLEVQKFCSDEMINSIINIGNCIKEIYTTLEIAQQFAIRYVEAKYINNNYFLQRRYYDELIKCTSCNFVDATDKFSIALDNFYLYIPKNND